MSEHEACGREIAQLMEEAREKYAEIERLRAENSNLKRIVEDWRIAPVSLYKGLITELADALNIVTCSLREAVTKEEVAPCAIENLNDLARRAREVTKDE